MACQMPCLCHKPLPSQSCSKPIAKPFALWMKKQSWPIVEGQTPTRAWEKRHPSFVFAQSLVMGVVSVCLSPATVSWKTLGQYSNLNRALPPILWVYLSLLFNVDGTIQKQRSSECMCKKNHKCVDLTQFSKILFHWEINIHRRHLHWFSLCFIGPETKWNKTN